MARFLVGEASPTSPRPIPLLTRPPSFAGAARRRRAASPSLLLAVRLRGKHRLALDHAVLAPPVPLRPCLAGAAAVAVRDVRARARRTTRAVAALPRGSRPLASP